MLSDICIIRFANTMNNFKSLKVHLIFTKIPFSNFLSVGNHLYTSQYKRKEVFSPSGAGFNQWRTEESVGKGTSSNVPPSPEAHTADKDSMQNIFFICADGNHYTAENYSLHKWKK